MPEQNTVDQRIPVYFIGVDYPANIGTLNYTVRGKSYQVPRNEDGSPDIGAAMMADPNDIEELISKARYFNGKVNVEVFTTDSTIAAAVTKAFDKGKKTPIEARLVGNGRDIIVAPSKDEVISMLTDEEIANLVKQRGIQVLPTDLSGSGQFAPNADASALARAHAVEDAQERPMTAAEKRQAAKVLAEAEQAAKLVN